MCRALCIDEARFGTDHPSVAISLHNPAQLVVDTNRLSEAKPLMRRHVEIFLRFTRDNGIQHLLAGLAHYRQLLKKTGDSKAQIRAKVDALLALYGVSI